MCSLICLHDEAVILLESKVFAHDLVSCKKEWVFF